ncbi:MAG: PP2C family protein-serine/threonine phosphatase [Terracidiphilus sp.]
MLLRGWDRRTTVFLAFALLVPFGLNLANAQVFDLERDRVQMAELKGLWRFHTGDDPDGKLGWASPIFDDSNWALIQPDRSWDDQGYKGYTGFAWYRAQVSLPAKRTPLALLLPHISTSYPVFADGRLIGQFGGLPPHAVINTQPPQIFPLLGEDSSFQKPVLIAIRVWHSEPLDSQDAGGLTEAPRLGEVTVVAGSRDYHMKTLFWSSAATALHLPFELFAAAAGLALFFLRRSDREYLWFAAYQIFGSTFDANSVHRSFGSDPTAAYDLVASLASFAWYVSLLGLVMSLLKERRGLIFWAATALAFVRYFLVDDPLHRGWIRDPLQVTVDLSIAIPLYAVIIGLLYKGAKRGNRDGSLLLFPFLFNFAVWTFGESLSVVLAYGHSAIGPLLSKFLQLYDWPFPFGVGDIAGFLCDFATLAILVARFARSRRDEERFKSELEAARTVQQVLIPEEIPAIPGLALECVYKPAGEVSGDFFQILPTPSNGVLIVIGDVSGKGMPAAMTVSLLVGTVRTLAHYTQSPTEILTAMNQRMLGRSKHGFTTSLVLRLDPDGSATVANAGHLAPYQGSKELPVESALPLGLAAQTEYVESTFHLDPDGELTLVTDGIAEARAKTGELFGFERTASIAILSAQHIAATAIAFGQQDDITVIKIRRQPAPLGAQVLAGA